MRNRTEIDVALQRIAAIILSGDKGMQTEYGYKTQAGLMDLIYQEIGRACKNMTDEEILEYFDFNKP